MNETVGTTSSFPGNIPPDRADDAVRDIARGLGLPDLIARILVARGITTPEEAGIFLRPGLGDLSDPFLLPDMEKGVRRLIDAIRRGEDICLYGDYDADGVSCLALMFNFLKHLGITPFIHIPTREEGYGLHVEAVKEIGEKGASLIISLDCGSSNTEEIIYAASLGIDTIVVDHHEMSSEPPPAAAVINPKRKDSGFPTRDLAACGVTFFFLLGLRRIMHAEGLIPVHINLKRELDIVTVGTIGDMVPLTGDNRILVRHGMETMNKRPRAWLRSMLDNRIVPKGLVNEFALGFVIVPRINAAGRVGRPHKSLDFLVSDDSAAPFLLAELQKANSERQKLEKKIHEEILGSIKAGSHTGTKSIVVFKDGWHTGVLGIVAQKLTEQFGKPSIVITRVNGVWKGSGRGGDGMDLFETVHSLSGLLLKYGGHKYACGISLKEENLLPFAEGFEKAVEGGITIKKREVHIDTPAEFDELTREVMDRLEELGPFGIGNPRPNLLLVPASIITTGNGRTKIVDSSNRTWYGFYPVKGASPMTEGAGIIASPVVRMEMRERFIHLNIKEMIMKGDRSS